MLAFDGIVDAFWEARALRGVPDRYAGILDAEQGLRVQLAVQERYDRAGDPRIGWKVAATNPAVQRQLGVVEPTFGSLRRSGRHRSGHRLDVASLVQPHVECEVCFELNEAISEAESLDGIRLAVGKAIPAFEIVEKRVPMTDLGGAIADNAEHAAVVLGEATDSPANVDFAAVRCELQVDGGEADSATGDAVLGDPLNSILWLKRSLERRGLALRPGSLVMTGSFLRRRPIRAGETFVARFTGLGSVEVAG